MTLESKSAFARRIGVNKSTITRAAQAGRLVLDETGSVMIEASLARWHATQGGRSDVAERHAQQRGHAIPSLPAYEADSESAATGLVGGLSPDVAGVAATQHEAQPASDGRTRYKTMVLQYENEAIKLEMALRRGLRHPLADVRREALGLGVALRADMERLIDQTAPRLAAEDRPAARLELLRAECAALARSVRLEFVRALRRLRQQQGRPSS